MQNIRHYGELRMIKTTFYDFTFANIYLEETERLFAFDLMYKDKKIMTVTDVRDRNTSPQGINVLLVDKEKRAHLPEVQKAIARVRKDFKEVEYEYKANSDLTPLLNQGFLGALQLTAELAYLGLQFAVIRDLVCTDMYFRLKSTTPKDQIRHVLDTMTFSYAHVGNNKIALPMSMLSTNTLISVHHLVGEVEPNYTEKMMEYAGSKNQYMAGVVVLPLTHAWGTKLTLQNILDIYL